MENKRETYRYHQNNSGGFVVDMPTLTASEGYVEGFDVYIYALSKEAANRIAQDKGLYFDGVEKGIDCECCGDRWHAAWYPEADYASFDNSAHSWNEHHNE